MKGKEIVKKIFSSHQKKDKSGSADTHHPDPERPTSLKTSKTTLPFTLTLKTLVHTRFKKIAAKSIKRNTPHYSPPAPPAEYPTNSSQQKAAKPFDNQATHAVKGGGDAFPSCSHQAGREIPLTVDDSTRECSERDRLALKLYKRGQKFASASPPDWKNCHTEVWEATRLNESFWEAWRLRGLASLERGRYSLAVDEYKQAESKF